MNPLPEPGPAPRVKRWAIFGKIEVEYDCNADGSKVDILDYTFTGKESEFAKSFTTFIDSLNIPWSDIISHAPKIEDDE